MSFVQTLFIAIVVALIGLWHDRKIREIKIDVNSRMTELLELTRKSYYAIGVKDEKERHGD